MPAPSHVQAASALRSIAFGMRASQALYVAAKLGVADHLARKPMTGTELANLAGVDADALRRVMRALCASGVFAESGTGEFSLTPTSHLLRSDVPGSFRAAVLFMTGNVRWRCWGDFIGSVEAGGGGAERTLGMALFDFYAAHPEESAVHDQAMRGLSAAQISAVLAAMDFADAGVVVDVGGGTGELLAAILAAHASLRGILFDLPHVVAHAGGVMAGRGVADRVEIVGGSFFDGVPGGGNTYVMKTVIHDWDDARAARILASCRKAMTPGDKLLLIERELPEIGQPMPASEPFLLDLEMLVMTPGGRERSRSEFRTLLASAQFELVGSVATTAAVSLIEARPI